MAQTLPIRANTEVLGFYHKQKSEFHFQEKTDNDFLMFLLDTAVRVISIVQHLAPVIEAVSDASADAVEDLGDDDDVIDCDFPNNRSTMDVDNINREVDEIIQLPPEPIPPSVQTPAPKPITISTHATQPPTQITKQLYSQQPRHQPSVPSQIPAPVAVSSAQYSATVSSAQYSAPVSSTQYSASASSAQYSGPVSSAQYSASGSSSQYSTPVSSAQYSTHIGASAVPVSLSVSETPAAAHPTPAPQTSSQPTASSNTAVPEPAYNQFAPAPEPDDNSSAEVKSETVHEVVTIKDEVVEPMQISAASDSQLLPQETINQLMNTLQSNEDNIGVANLVTTAQPSSLSSTFLDKSNNPLSMLSLSNTTSSINNLFPAKTSGANSANDAMPGSSRGGELKSLMDSKAGGSGTSNPRTPPTSLPIPPGRRPKLASSAAESSSSVPGYSVSGLCPHCFLPFANVQRHVSTVHLKLRPFNCFYCNKSFTQSGHRLHHMRNQHKHELGNTPKRKL